MRESEGYIVRVYTKRLPGGFRGPKFIRKLMSALSESGPATWGNSLLGMPKDEAEKIAQMETVDLFVDRFGKLRSSKGVVVNVEDIPLIDRV